MRALPLAIPGQPLSVLCLGAHSDDIEIGTGGTQLGWISAGVHLQTHWCVLSTTAERDEITPTMKLKRNIVAKNHKHILEKLYE